MQKLTQLLTILLIMIFTLTLAGAGTALAQRNGEPLHPAVFVGAAILDRETAPDGVTVAAVIDGVEAATTTTSAGSYALRIPPNPQTDYSNMTIIFTVDGHRARETAQWTSNGGGLLNLNAARPGPARMQRGVLGVNTVLADEHGLPLYSFDQDTPATRTLPAVSACTSAECLALWAPLSTLGAPVAELDIDQNLLSTTEHPITGLQATYNGQPLYRYRKDVVPGTAAGQGSGRQWWVISTAGQPIQGAGVSGNAGIPGNDGRPGEPGTDGPSGPQGAQGPPGLEGQPGMDGKDGRNGWDGDNGAPGADGADGAPGPEGKQGETGETGPPGPPPIDGLQGPPGQNANNTIVVAAMVIALLALAAAAAGQVVPIIRKRSG